MALSPQLATARSSLPSPLKSASATAFGLIPTHSGLIPELLTFHSILFVLLYSY